MPFPLIPLIGAGVSAVASWAANRNANRKNRRFATTMYERQRDDNRQNWRDQNEYNNPTNQRKRMEAAGLNPALMYGSQASSGNAQSVQGAGSGNVNHKPLVEGSLAQGFFDTQVKNAQSNNLEVQNTVLKNEAILKSAQTVSEIAKAKKYGIDTDSSKFDLGLKQSLRKFHIDAQRLSNIHTAAGIDNVNSQRYERDTLLNPRLAQLQVGIQKQLQSINLDKRQISYIQSKIDLNKADLKLREDNIYPSDPMWARMMASKSRNDVQKVVKKIRSVHPQTSGGQSLDITNFFNFKKLIDSIFNK